MWEKQISYNIWADFSQNGQWCCMKGAFWKNYTTSFRIAFSVQNIYSQRGEGRWNYQEKYAPAATVSARSIRRTTIRGAHFALKKIWKRERFPAVSSINTCRRTRTEPDIPMWILPGKLCRRNTNEPADHWAAADHALRQSGRKPEKRHGCRPPGKSGDRRK